MITKLDFRYPDKPTTATPDFLKSVDESDFACQAKKDGWRVLVYAHHNVELLTRHNKTLQEALKAEIESDLADEICKLGDDIGLTIYDGEFTGRRESKKQSIVLFDLMMFDNQWITNWPYRHRFAMLNNLVAKKLGSNENQIIDVVETIDKDFYAYFEKLKLGNQSGDKTVEGVVLKRWDSTLIGHRQRSIDNPHWFKAKWD